MSALCASCHRSIKPEHGYRRESWREHGVIVTRLTHQACERVNERVAAIEYAPRAA